MDVLQHLLAPKNCQKTKRWQIFYKAQKTLHLWAVNCNIKQSNFIPITNTIIYELIEL